MSTLGDISCARQRDPSMRWILPDDSTYLKNMAALWAVDPGLAERIEALESQPSHAVEPSKAGAPTVVVPTDNGRRVYLHSRYQPLEEARKLVADVDVESSVAFYVHGLGLGYHLELLYEKAGDETMFFVFEPDLLLLRTLLETRDVSAMLMDNRVQFVTEADKAALMQRLMPHLSFLSLGTGSVEHGPSVQRFAAFHAQMKAWIDEFASYVRTSMNTLVLNGRRTAENIACNLAWYAATASIGRLKDRYKGKPAIIVSAGPSLRKNKHLLHQASGRAVIVAVQTTLQPLIDMGIEPQFVTSLDYHDICTRFFEKLPASVKTELVAEPKATARIFSMYPGPLSVLGNEFAERMLREMELRKACLPAGATVAHLAYYLCEHLGCDPIIFIGQDLGFSDGLCYTPGTSYEDVWRPELSAFCTVEMKQWEQIARDRPILRRIPDVNGQPMYTEERLFAYLQQFERDFGRSGARIIDASEGGALKRGAKPMTLAAALAEFCGSPLNDAARDATPMRKDVVGQCLKCVEARQEEAGQIEEIALATLPLLEEVRDHLDDQERVNRAIARIDALRARMDLLGSCYDLIMQLTQTSELERFRRDRQIAASKVQGMERQRRQITRDIANVRSVATAAADFRKLTSQVIEHLNADAKPGGPFA